MGKSLSAPARLVPLAQHTARRTKSEIPVASPSFASSYVNAVCAIIAKNLAHKVGWLARYLPSIWTVSWGTQIPQS